MSESNFLSYVEMSRRAGAWGRRGNDADQIMQHALLGGAEMIWLGTFLRVAASLEAIADALDPQTRSDKLARIREERERGRLRRRVLRCRGLLSERIQALAGARKLTVEERRVWRMAVRKIMPETRFDWREPTEESIGGAERTCRDFDVQSIQWSAIRIGPKTTPKLAALLLRLGLITPEQSQAMSEPLRGQVRNP